MGLDISVLKVAVLDRPVGNAYEFAQDMAAEGALTAWATGEGHSWIPFTQRQTLRLLDAFTEGRSLSASERLTIRDWLAALPWEGGWRDALPQPDAREDDPDYDPIFDYEAEYEGPRIELSFTW